MLTIKHRLIYSTIMQYFPILLLFVYFNTVITASIFWWVSCLIVMFTLAVFGFSIAFHHTFTHKTFKFSRPIEILLMYVGTCATLVSPIVWTMAHSEHHRSADTENDPHSPTHLGWRLLFYYFHDTKKPSLLAVRHLLKDKVQVWFNSNVGYWSTVLSLPILAYIIGGIRGLIFIWAIPTWYVLFVGIIFTLAHYGETNKYGHKAKDTWVLGLFSFGDGNHERHHNEWNYIGNPHTQFAKILGGKKVKTGK